MLHSVINTNSDTNSYVTNEKRELEKEVETCLASHLI